MASNAHEPSTPLSVSSEQALVQRAQSGDSEAFAALYRAYIQAIYRYLFLRLSNSHLAEDLAADVFVRAADGLPRYSNRGLPFGAWLFRIAHDRLVDHYRQSERRPVADLAEDLSSDLPDPSLMAEDSEMTQALYLAMQQLTDEQRNVIQFRFMENWSLEETARMMNKSLNAIKALQHRALGALGRLLEGRQ